MVDVATAIGAAPVLHWKGVWSAYGQSMTLDLRAVGDGDAIGTVTDKGDSAQIMVVDGNRLLLKGGKAYWRHGGTSSADVARFADRWVDEGAGVWGADLGDLAPRTLSKSIKSDHQATGPSDSAVTPLPWTPAPATSMPATPRPTPSGVPAGALRFTVDHSISSLTDGTYWASASAPHILVSYSGAGLPGDDSDLSSVKQTTLSVQAGSADDARAAYIDLAAQARKLPKTMAVESVTSSQFQVDKVDLPNHCRTGNCHIKVTGTAANGPKSLQATVAVTLLGSRSMAGGGGKKVGTCHIRMHAAPGKTVHGSCNVTDPGVDRYWNSLPGSVLKIAYWYENHQVSDISAQEPFDPTALATELTNRANAPLAVHTPMPTPTT